MRNSARQHNRESPFAQRYARRRALACCAVLAGTWALCAPGLAAEPDRKIRSEDMVVVHADQAWEEPEPETLRFNGNFEMRVRDWVFRADSATVNGTLDNPSRVELKGSPARIDLSGATPGEAIRGEAQEIVYERTEGTVALVGNAELKQGENRLHSSRIDYEINSDRVRAAGVTGVQIRIRP
jgi:lipopolysaccharide transport protein LptA